MTPEGIAAWWALIATNGVPFLLFVAFLALFTGQVFSKRQADQLLALQRERYEDNEKRLEQLWRDERARADRMEQLLFQRDALASRIGAIAERIVEKPAGVVPPTTAEA